MDNKNQTDRSNLAVGIFAVLIAMHALILVFSGSIVTTHQVGMAVPDYPTTNGENMFTFNYLAEGVSEGVRMEHRHRLIGSLVGFWSILLVMFVALKYPLKSVQMKLSIASLLLIIVQGLLGGSRVYFNNAGLGRELAMLHGFFAYISLLALVMLIYYSVSKTKQFTIEPQLHIPISKVSFLLSICMLVQLFLGIILRQNGGGVVMIQLWTHVAVGLAIFLLAAFVTFIVLTNPSAKAALTKESVFIIAALVLQLLTGLASALLTQVKSPGIAHVPQLIETISVTSHHLGALILFISSFLMFWKVRTQTIAIETDLSNKIFGNESDLVENKSVVSSLKLEGVV